MAGVIKGVLKEELKNSYRMKKAYEKALKEPPPGHVAVKVVRKNFYTYQVRRVGKRVQFRYVGKASKLDWEKYQEAKEMRAKYRKLLSQSKKQIRYLKGTLRGKEAI